MHGRERSAGPGRAARDADEGGQGVLVIRGARRSRKGEAVAHMIRRNVDERRQLEKYPHPRASLHGDHVVAACPRSEDDPELGLLQAQPQELSDSVPLGLKVRRNVPGEGHDDPFALRFLVHLGANPHRSGLLDPPDGPDQPRKLRVR